MAVEIKYIVVREGQEKMAFASKKDADAYDKMLDLAEVLNQWLQQGPVSLADEQGEELAMWMAENKDVLNTLLKNGKLPLTTDARTDEAPAADADPQNKQDEDSRKPRRVA